MSVPYRSIEIQAEHERVSDAQSILTFTIPATPPGMVMDACLPWSAQHRFSRHPTAIAPGGVAVERLAMTLEDDVFAPRGVFAHWDMITAMDVRTGNFHYQQSFFRGYADCLTRLLYSQTQIKRLHPYQMAAMSGGSSQGMGFLNAYSEFHPVTPTFQDGGGAAQLLHNRARAINPAFYRKKLLMWQHANTEAVAIPGHPGHQDHFHVAFWNSVLPPPMGHPFANEHFYVLKDPMSVRLTLVTDPRVLMGATRVGADDMQFFHTNVRITCHYKSVSFVESVPQSLTLFTPILLNRHPYTVGTALVPRATHDIQFAGSCVIHAPCTVIMCAPIQNQTNTRLVPDPYTVHLHTLSIFYRNEWIELNAQALSAMFDAAKHPDCVYANGGIDPRRSFIAFSTHMFVDMTYPCTLQYTCQGTQYDTQPVIAALNAQPEFAYVVGLYNQQYTPEVRRTQFVSNKF